MTLRIYIVFLLEDISGGSGREHTGRGQGLVMTKGCCWHRLQHLCRTSEYSREGHGTPLQYSCLGNPMDGGAWWAAVQGVAKSQTQLSNFPFTFHFHALKKEMATHSSVLAWRVPEMGAPGGLLSMKSHRVGYD